MRQDLLVRSKIKRIFLGSILLMGLVAMSSDISAQQQGHFTDFRMAPSAINPGLTGAFKGTYRINGLYRGQWGNFGDSKAAKTIVASAEFNVKGGLLLENDWISAGLSFYNDQAGTANRKYNSTGFSVGYHIGLDDDYTNVFSVGLNYSSLGSTVSNYRLLGDITNSTSQPNFSSGQFEGECNLPGCDTQNQGPSKGSDISLGVTYKTEVNSNIVRFGLALNHLNAPETTIAVAKGGGRDSTVIPGPTTDPNRTLDAFRRNLVFHAEASTLISPKVRLNPAFLFMTSGGTTEIQVQSTMEYLVNAKEQFSLIGGIGFRPLPSFDAGYLIGGIRMKDLTVRLSYDITLSSLARLGGGNGFEMSVGYIGRIYKDPNVDKVIFCPRL